MLVLKINNPIITLKRLFFPFIIAFCCVISLSVHAHFQLLYTPELLRAKGGEVNFKLPFTHPAASGHVMSINKPQAFYMLKKGKKTDLIETVSGMEWTSSVDTGQAYQADVKLRGLGDHVFILQPSPYFEVAEDIYIQQITKTIVNVGNLPTDWNKSLFQSIVNVGNLPTDWNKDFGLTAEIVPLTKPYAIYEGGIFSAVVKSNGQPIPFAAVEVEFMNYKPDMVKNQFSKTPIMTPPSEVFVTQTIYTDANGTFHFSLLKAGQWGFAALGIGEQKNYQGKTLSQDAVIWVQATKRP